MNPSADASPGFIDIVELEVGAVEGSISLSMSLAASVPPATPVVGKLAFRFYLDVDGDGAWDRQATLESVPGGGFVPTLVDRGSGGRLAGPAYPGTASLAGRRITLTVRLDHLGCPAVIGVRATAEQTRAGGTVREEAPEPAEAWSRVETGCPTS